MNTPFSTISCSICGSYCEKSAVALLLYVEFFSDEVLFAFLDFPPLEGVSHTQGAFLIVCGALKFTTSSRSGEADTRNLQELLHDQHSK